MQDELVTEPITHHEGWMLPPAGDGLGIEMRPDVVERFRLDR
jgi:L-alanine-DL-glutamate epimerase-like enolase superfamily enzyme